MFLTKYSYGSRRITSLYDYIKIWNKNRKLNESIKKFTRKHKSQIKPREKHLKPEVIITSYNQGKFVDRAITSVRASSKNIDITVIDDASQDNSQELIQKLKKRYAFTYYPNIKNMGFHASVNMAVKKSSNNLFILLNADDVLARYSIHTILELMKNTNVRLVASRCLQFRDEKTIRLNRNFPKKLSYRPTGHQYGPQDAKQFTQLNDISMTASSTAFLKSAWESIGGFVDFKNRVCHVADRDFQMRICALFDILILEEPLGFYMVHENNTFILQNQTNRTT